MHNRLWIAAVFAATPILALGPVAFPASNDPGCVRAVPADRYNLRLFKSLMRRKDDNAVKTLAVYNVPRVKSLDVRPVFDPVVCARAALAYGRALSVRSAGRKVQILRVGDRYIVTDPEYQPDAYHRAATFDSTFSRALAIVAE
jgi:hypothetical protein